jgi:hypothetical protein
MRDEYELPNGLKYSSDVHVLIDFIDVAGAEPFLLVKPAAGNRSVTMHGSSIGNTIVTGDVKGDFVPGDKRRKE